MNDRIHLEDNSAFVLVKSVTKLHYQYFTHSTVLLNKLENYYNVCFFNSIHYLKCNCIEICIYRELA